MDVSTSFVKRKQTFVNNLTTVFFQVLQKNMPLTFSGTERQDLFHYLQCFSLCCREGIFLQFLQRDRSQNMFFKTRRQDVFYILLYFRHCFRMSGFDFDWVFSFRGKRKKKTLFFSCFFCSKTILSFLNNDREGNLNFY